MLVPLLTYLFCLVDCHVIWAVHVLGSAQSGDSGDTHLNLRTRQQCFLQRCLIILHHLTASHVSNYPVVSLSSVKEIKWKSLEEMLGQTL